MKKVFAIGTLVLLLLGAGKAHAQYLQRQERASLDTAIRRIATELSSRFGRNTRIAVVSMTAGTTELADYLVDNMIVVFQQVGEFTIIDRDQIDLLVYGAGFQTDREMDIAQARALGIILGANVLVTGEFEPRWDFFRLNVRIIDAQSGQYLDFYEHVENDNIVALLLGRLTENRFTVGQRLNTMFLNLLPGLGSFVIMNDMLGSGIQLLMATSGWAVFFVGREIRNEDLVIGGVLLAGAQVLLNVVRSLSHMRSVPVTLEIDPGLLNVSGMPRGNGPGRISVSRTLRF